MHDERKDAYIIYNGRYIIFKNLDQNYFNKNIKIHRDILRLYLKKE